MTALLLHLFAFMQVGAAKQNPTQDIGDAAR
jgi:hypothetical protein